MANGRQKDGLATGIAKGKVKTGYFFIFHRSYQFDSDFVNCQLFGYLTDDEFFKHCHQYFKKLKRKKTK